MPNCPLLRWQKNAIAWYRAEADISNERLGKLIRNAEGQNPSDGSGRSQGWNPTASVFAPGFWRTGNNACKYGENGTSDR